MKIATWNVNSIKVRLDGLLTWLEQETPDLVCLQEIKCLEEKFPRLELEGLGYQTAILGQKSYNGVALLSRRPLEDVTTGLPGFEDEQARYIEAVVSVPIGALRVASIYLPNGNPAPGPKYDYKLAFMDALIAHARALLANEEAFVLAGDYNVIPADRDVHDPAAWAGDALFRPETQAKFRELMNLGLYDAFRACHGEGGRYSFWDYQAGAWPKNHGIRIDHLLMSPQAADLLIAADIDTHLRGWEKASDHVPVWAEFDVGEDADAAGDKAA